MSCSRAATQAHRELEAKQSGLYNPQKKGTVDVCRHNASRGEKVTDQCGLSEVLLENLNAHAVRALSALHVLEQLAQVPARSEGIGTKSSAALWSAWKVSHVVATELLQIRPTCRWWCTSSFGVWMLPFGDQMLSLRARKACRGASAHELFIPR